MFPFSLLPFVLFILFLSVWGFVMWLKFREHLHLVRHHEQERAATSFRCEKWALRVAMWKLNMKPASSGLETLAQPMVATL